MRIPGKQCLAFDVAVILQCLLSISSVLLVSPRLGAQDAVDPRSDAVGHEFFRTNVEPILRRRCYACHSHEAGKAKGGLVLDSRLGWAKGGNEGPAVKPGDPGESILVQAVRYDGWEMPPDGQIPKSEVAVLERWVSMGAPDPRESQASRVDPKKLWALQPIRRHVIPRVRDEAWPRDESDYFLLSRLEDSGLLPANDADRYTLLRRVTIDLTGLPPSPIEIESFLSDRSQQAYERVVDRLLGSAAFGDHWARHWFDLSCYADLADIQGNVLVRDAWRYRDYVIQSFNEDKPLDQFIRQQLAGDLLPWDSVEQRREQIIATGYLAIGPWTLQNYIKPQLDADVVDHQIDRIGRTFLAQTISCARCHDHKFDPVPTADYYALAGIFHSTLTTTYDGPGVWSSITETQLPLTEDQQETLERRRMSLDRLQNQRTTIRAALADRVSRIPGATDGNSLTMKEGVDANVVGISYELKIDLGPTVWAAAGQRTRDQDGLRIDVLNPEHRVVASFLQRMEAWQQTKDSQVFSSVTYRYVGDGSGSVRLKISSLEPGNSRFGGAVTRVRIVAKGAGDGAVIFEDDFSGVRPGKTSGRQADTQLAVFAGVEVPGWDGDGLNHSHAVRPRSGEFAIQFFGGRMKDWGKLKPKHERDRKSLAEAKRLNVELLGIQTEIAKLERELAPEYALAVRDVNDPLDSAIYRRGDFQNLGSIVPRGFLTSLPNAGDPIPANSSGRLQLADWLIDKSNPLTSRVLVNRIWHHLFGKGIVRTVDYFGVQGEQPSHPELLDFLADRFRKTDRWSLKSTIRRLVLSRAYQMASDHDARAVELDPLNRLLWRMPRRRLNAESIRDAMLFASGVLDRGRGGSPLGLELAGNVQGIGDQVNPPRWGGKVPENVQNRRTVYLPFKRELPADDLEILSTFDFPHPNDIVGARPQTNVATQALFLLNAPFVKQQAAELAKRLKREYPRKSRERVNQLYLLTLSRPAAASEIDTGLDFVSRCELELGEDGDGAWTQLCHAVFGANAFLFRE